MTSPPPAGLPTHVLVTGAAGFIGSHVSEALLAAGCRVTGLDNLDPYYDVAIKRRNLAQVQAAGRDRFEFVEGDIRDRALLDRLLGQAGPTGSVVHLAALAGVRPSIARPLDYLDVNVRGSWQILEACRAAGVDRIVVASSSSVYGVSDRVPFREGEEDEPISPYAATKRSVEHACATYASLHRISSVNLRFFTVYGPRQRPDLAIHKFTRLISQGDPIPVYGDGSSQRDYTFIDDIVAGVLGSLRWVWERPGGVAEVVNLGESQTVSLAGLITALERAIGREALIDRQPDQPGDVPRTYAAIDRARALFGYDPQVGLEEGLARFVAWYRSQAAG